MKAIARSRQLLVGDSVSFVSAATFATAGLAAVASVLMTRAIDPADRGRVAATLAAGLLASLVTTAGLDSAVRVVLPRCPTAAVKARYVRIASRLVGVASVVGGIAAAYLGITSISITAVDVTFLILFVMLATLAAFGRGGCYAEGKANAAAGADMAGAGIQALVVLCAAVVRPTVTLFYIAYLFGMAVPAVLYLRLLGQGGWLAPATSTTEETAQARGELSAEARRLFGGRLAMSMTYRLDRLLLALLSQPAQLGHYAAAVSLADVAVLLPTAASQVILGRAAHHAQGARRRDEILRPTIAAVGFAVVVAIVMAVWSSTLVRWLYGRDYAAAAASLRVLAVGSVFIAVWRLLATDLLARGFGRLFTGGAVLSLVVTVVACAVLIPRDGAVGAAWASVAAYGAAAVLAVRWSLRHGVLRP